MKIFITETQFKKLRKFLTEISVEDAYSKYYKDIPKQDFDEILVHDPLSKPNFLSPYGKWLLKIYKNKNLRLEDLQAAAEYIQTYERYKDKYKNVDWNKLNTLADLYNVIKDDIAYSQSKTGNVNLCQPIKDSEKIYEDENWCVIIPETEYTACYYGRNTEWCTAWGEMSFDERHKGKTNRFNGHNNQGQLYININKNNQNEKFQFHFESGQYMDVKDNQIDLFSFLNKNPKLKDFYNNFFKEKLKDTRFSDLIINDSGCYIWANNWLDFSPVFEIGRNQINPAIILNRLDEEDFDYDFYLSDYFYLINQSNLKFMTDFLIKNGDITEDADDEEIMEKIIDDFEFSVAIDNALRLAKDVAVKAAFHDDIISEIKKYYNIRDIEYKNNGIFLKMVNCPEPVLLWSLNDKDFIEGYTNIYDKINFRVSDYQDYYDKDPDRKLFNEYLSENLNDL
jgi:hypothetical protein